jgi:hypothetical protein
MRPSYQRQRTLQHIYLHPYEFVMLAWIVTLGGVLGCVIQKIAKVFCVGIQRAGRELGYLGSVDVINLKKK